MVAIVAAVAAELVAAVALALLPANAVVVAVAWAGHWRVAAKAGCDPRRWDAYRECAGVCVRPVAGRTDEGERPPLAPLALLPLP